MIFHFHACAARDALEELASESGSTPHHGVLMLLGGGTEEERERHYRLKLASEAHILSTLLTTRIMFDHLAQVANQVILNRKLSVEECDLHKVRKKLPAGPLKDILDALTSSHWFRYVDGFTNTVKHRELIRQPLHVSMTDESPEVRLSAFEFRETQFPGYTAAEVLVGAFEVKNKIIDCGRAINEALGVSP